jgi:carbon storage regulator
VPGQIRQNRPGETLIIETPTGERIQVTVLEVNGNQIRIDTNQPADIAIVREELLDRLPAEG